MSQYDVLVWGATGFTGNLAAKYIASHYLGNSENKEAANLRVALVGRNKAKLETTKQQMVKISDACDSVGIIVADANDQKSVDAAVRQGKVVLSTVGPFIKYGEPLVASCAEHGVDYCDITGEAIFVRQMSDKYGEKAKANGSLIVSCCGYDSVPSDIGVFYTVSHIKEQLNSTPAEVDGFHTMKGGASGGTLATIMNMIDMGGSVLKEMAHPFYLNENKSDKQITDHDKDIKGIGYSKTAKKWYTPFVMAGINTRVVRRSDSFLKYGDNFSYNEVTPTGGLCAAIFMILGLACFGCVIYFRCLRSLCSCLIPKPGQGPSEKMQRTGWWNAKFYAKTDKGETVRTKLTGKGDPGYASTCKMLSEAAFTMLFHRDQLPAGGVMPPAAALGKPFIKRLIANADITFEVLKD